MTFNLYNILQLDKNNNPSQGDIKKAYKKLAMEFHPDKNKELGADDKFKKISNAYNILSDDKKKQFYDMTGDEGYNNQDNNNNNMDTNDIFEHLFRNGGMPQHFSSHFGGFDNNENSNKKCNNNEKNIHISLEDAYNGLSKNIKLNILFNCLNCYSVCSNCNGSGIIKKMNNMGLFTQIFTCSCDKCNQSGFITENNKNCSNCKGTCKYNKEVNAHLLLPAGINNNYKTIFPEMGEQPKKKSQKAGDLIINIIIDDNSLFKRKDNDLYYKTSITFLDSIIGKEFEINYFNEIVKINTNSFGIVHPNKQYLIKNMGMPIINTKNKGNMFIEFSINYPSIKNLNNEDIDNLIVLINKIYY